MNSLFAPDEVNTGRQMGVDMHPQADVYVFLTQDAILAGHDSLEKLVRVFEDKSIGCAYGRQLSHEGAGLFARAAREINYPSEGHVRVLADRGRFGIRQHSP